MNDGQYFEPGAPSLELPKPFPAGSEQPEADPRPPRPEMPPLGPEEPGFPPADPDPNPSPFPHQGPEKNPGWTAMQWIVNPGRTILGLSF
jgi:hypothetical protein